jgi:hypothetical protein
MVGKTLSNLHLNAVERHPRKFLFMCDQDFRRPAIYLNQFTHHEEFSSIRATIRENDLYYGVSKLIQLKKPIK